MGKAREPLGLKVRSGLAVLAVVTALSVVTFGLASAALLGQAEVAQRAVVTTLARGFAAGFEKAQLERPAELREGVDALRDMHPELREATIVATASDSPSVIASTLVGARAAPWQRARRSRSAMAWRATRWREATIGSSLNSHLPCASSERRRRRRYRSPTT